MSEKRFTIDNTNRIFDNKDIMSKTEVVAMLNQLYDENEQLRKELQIFRDGLKAEIRETKEVFEDYSECVDEKLKVKEENEQLRDELTFLNKVIGFFADNPMTKYSSKSELLEEMKLFEKMGLI